jgi:hypothetical protein
VISSEAYERAKRFLLSRAMVYRRLFDLQNRDAQDVLRDLAKFCRAHASTAHLDTHAAARLDGRREVWLRLQNHLQLSDEDLWKLYGEK